MSEPIDLPRLPKDRIKPSPRAVSELRPGERVVLNVITNLETDEEGHVWVDASSEILSGGSAPGLALRAERTEGGFILWLDRQVKFERGRRGKHGSYLPVVEFRELPEGEA